MQSKKAMKTLISILCMMAFILMRKEVYAFDGIATLATQQMSELWEEVSAKEYEMNIILDAIGIKNWTWPSAAMDEQHIIPDNPLGEYSDEKLKEYTDENFDVEFEYLYGYVGSSRFDLDLIQSVKIYKDNELYYCMYASWWGKWVEIGRRYCTDWEDTEKKTGAEALQNEEWKTVYADCLNDMNKNIFDSELPLEIDVNGVYQEYGNDLLLLNGTPSKLSDYYLYDITSDGIPELLVTCYSYFADSALLIISYDGNALRYIGQCELEKIYLLYFDDKENELLAAEYLETQWNLSKINITSDEVVKQKIYEENEKQWTEVEKEILEIVPNALPLPSDQMNDKLLISVYDRWMSDHKTQFIATNNEDSKLRQSYLDAIEQNVFLQITTANQIIIFMRLNDYFLKYKKEVDDIQIDFIDLDNDKIEECVLSLYNKGNNEFCGYLILRIQEDKCYGFYFGQKAFELGKNGTFTAVKDGFVSCRRCYFDKGQWLVYATQTGSE